MAEFDLVRDPARGRDRGLHDRNDPALFLQKEHQVVDKERSFVDRGSGDDQGGDGTADRGERAGIEAVIADLQDPPVDLIGDVEKEQTV